MPPPMMTKVWPRATMPMKAASTSDRAQVRGGEEARREERGDEEEHDHPGIGEQDQAVAGEEGGHPARLPRRLLGERAREHGDEQDDARDDRLPVARDVQDEDEVADQGEDEGADQRAEQVAAAAEEADAADHRGGDREQDVVLADGRRAGAGLGGQVERGGGGEEAGEAVGQDVDPGDRDAGEEGRLLAGAGRLDGDAEAGGAEPAPEEDEGDQEPDRGGEAEEA